MYSFFLRMCIHHHTAIVHNVQNQKKITVIDGPPTLYSNVLPYLETNANSSNVMPWGQH